MTDEWELVAASSDDDWEDVGSGSQKETLPTSSFPAAAAAGPPEKPAASIPAATPPTLPPRVADAPKAAADASRSLPAARGAVHRDSFNVEVGSVFSALLVYCLATTFVQSRYLSAMHQAAFAKAPAHTSQLFERRTSSPFVPGPDASTTGLDEAYSYSWICDRSAPAANGSFATFRLSKDLTVFWSVAPAGRRGSSLDSNTSQPAPPKARFPALPAPPARLMLPAAPSWGADAAPYPLPPPCVLCALGHVSPCSLCTSRPLVTYIREQAELRSLAKMLINAASWA